MNNTYTTPMTASVTSAQRSNFTGTGSASTLSAHQPRYGSGSSSSMTIAERIFKLTGKVHLASRSAHHWHLCGINE